MNGDELILPPAITYAGPEPALRNDLANLLEFTLAQNALLHERIRVLEVKLSADKTGRDLVGAKKRKS